MDMPSKHQTKTNSTISKQLITTSNLLGLSPQPVESQLNNKSLVCCKITKKRAQEMKSHTHKIRKQLSIIPLDLPASDDTVIK